MRICALHHAHRAARGRCLSDFDISAPHDFVPIDVAQPLRKRQAGASQLVVSQSSFAGGGPNRIQRALTTDRYPDSTGVASAPDASHRRCSAIRSPPNRLWHRPESS